MLKPGPASKVTIHLNEDTSSNTSFIHEQVFQFLYDNGVAGATLIRPQAGFGSHHHRHARDAYGSAGLHLPVQIQFIESPEVISRLLPALSGIVTDGLIEVHDTNIVTAAKRGDPL